MLTHLSSRLTANAIPAYPRVKRFLDVMAASILLTLFAPVLLITAVLVKLTSRGPILYRQERLGQFGIPFQVLKLRTMRIDSESGTGPRWCTDHDPRVTCLGKILRTLHLDELPQLVNVLRNEMSLIGPRPERPTIAADLTRVIPGFADRLAVLPGLSGLAQAQYPADTDLGTVCRKLVADLTYVRSMSFALDLRIACATLVYLLRLPRPWARAILGHYAESYSHQESHRNLQDRLAAIYEVPQKPNRNQAVQGLRGLAASFVFLTHFLGLFGAYLGDGMQSSIAQGVTAIARSGTDLFLLISGYLIYGMAIRKPLNYGRFLADRFWRIYPAYLVVFGLYFLLSALIPAQSKIPADPMAAGRFVLENLALLPGLTGSPAMITVSWTLGYELMLYLSVPFIVRMLRMRDWRPQLRLLALVAIWVSYVAWCGLTAPSHVRLSIYLAAFIAYEVVGNHDGNRPSPLTLASTVIALIGVVVLRCGLTLACPGLPGFQALISAIFLAIFAFGSASMILSGGWLAQPLTWAPLRYLGNVSYSFYLLHGLVLKTLALVVTSVLPPAMTGSIVFWLVLPVSYLCAVAAATMLFVVIEKRISFAQPVAVQPIADGLGWKSDMVQIEDVHPTADDTIAEIVAGEITERVPVTMTERRETVGV